MVSRKSRYYLIINFANFKNVYKNHFWIFKLKPIFFIVYTIVNAIEMFFFEILIKTNFCTNKI